MKLFMGILFATLALNGVLSLPARSEDAEVIGGPRRVYTKADDDDSNEDGFTNFKGVIDTGSGYPFLQPNPSVIRVGFFDSFDDLFRRFSARLFPVGFFGRAGTDSDEDNSSELGFPNLDSKKANSTSTVKVVDGHKVEVNETVYGDENSVFKVRVVNIRPLEEGETVEETETKDIKPVTSGPDAAPTNTNNNKESDESDEKREPLEKKPLENEIQGNIDEPEHSKITEKNKIVESLTKETTYDLIMLPTADDINAEFVTDNSLEHEQETEEKLLNANGKGNNEFETNISKDNVEDADNVDNVENLEVVNAGEEVIDNLNKYSSITSSSSSSSLIASANNADGDADREQEYNEELDESNSVDAVDVDVDADADIDNLNTNLAAIRNKERETEFSSDDEEDAEANATEMHPTFNDEWDNLNEADKYDVISNAISEEEVDEQFNGKPFDLSRDIDVNNAANLPINPDADFIDGYSPMGYVPQFEKLSLNNSPPTK